MNVSCTSCGCAIRPDRKRKTTLCRTCANRRPRDPEAEARRKEKIRLTFAARPELAETARERSRSAMTPERRAKAAETIRAHRSWEKTPAEVMAKWQRNGAHAAREKRLGWCPPELRDLYAQLTKRRNFSAAEAREIVLAQHAKNMAAFRKSIGAE